MISQLWYLFLVGVTATPTVKTTFGELKGVQTSSGVREFLGIPFAKPPVGALRFMPPAQWTDPYEGGTRDATQYGAMCISNSQPASSGIWTKKAEEDCLYLNVWAPNGATPASPLPVMVFIHGGSFIAGSGSGFNGTFLSATGNVIVVTINYRLGSLGFLQPIKGHANFGLQDQRAALVWVKSEIAAFGGSGQRVTLFGESAGAISTMTHLVLPKSKGLFQRLISESGSLTAYPQAYALNNSAIYAKAVGCPVDSVHTIACLQGKSILELSFAERKVSPNEADPFNNPGWSPTIDNIELSDEPINLLRKGQFHRDVPVMAGSNTNEGTLFVYLLDPISYMNKKEFHDFLFQALNNGGHHTPEAGVDKVLDVYPPNNATFADNRALLSYVLGDSSFICGSRHFVRLVSSYGSPAYLYHFNERAKHDLSPSAYGVYHGSELPFVFGYNVNSLTPYTTTAEKALSAQMMKIWATFAATGNPNGKEVVWPLYINATDTSFVLNETMMTETAYRREYCDFWEQFNLN